MLIVSLKIGRDRTQLLTGYTPSITSQSLTSYYSTLKNRLARCWKHPQVLATDHVTRQRHLFYVSTRVESGLALSVGSTHEVDICASLGEYESTVCKGACVWEHWIQNIPRIRLVFVPQFYLNQGRNDMGGCTHRDRIIRSLWLHPPPHVRSRMGKY